MNSEEEILKISKKLNVLIAFSIRQLFNDADFSNKSRKKNGLGDLARHLSNMGLDPNDISEIVGSPVQSIRTLLTPKRQK